MSTRSYAWANLFKSCYHAALEQYKGNNRNPESYFTAESLAFLQSIGCRPIELYDFAEDCSELDWETALLITSIRRDYFLVVQDGQLSNKIWSVDTFPDKKSEMAGIPWLARLIRKAEARLRGELPSDLMYCCGGDRAFFKKWDIHPADFLRLTWSAGNNHAKIVEFIKGREKRIDSLRIRRQ